MNLQKFIYCIILLGAFTLVSPLNSIAQSNEFGFHISPVRVAPPNVYNESTLISGNESLGTSAGFNFTHFFKSGMGIRSNVSFGYTQSIFSFDKSFGEWSDFPVSPSTLLYNSITIEPVLRFNINKSTFEAFVAGDLRYYFPNVSQGLKVAEVARFRTYRTDDGFQPNIYSGVSYVVPLRKSKHLGISLIKNYGLTGVGYGNISSPITNSTYQSGYNSVTNSFGVRLQYTYTLEIKLKRD